MEISVHSNYAISKASRTDETNETNIETDTDTGTKSSSSTWVKNLSDKPLREAQECLLAHGPNFIVIPRCPFTGKYIVAIDHACSKLNQGDAEELRVEVKNILKKTQMPKSNITKEELQAIKELNKDDNRVILTADKGVAMVVLNKEDYIRKAEDLLSQQTYNKIPKDPTSRQKTKLINLLKNIKAEWGINEETYRIMYPTGSPKFYCLPKIIKPGIPLRPIVSSRGTVTYSTVKELAKILKPMLGMSSHHVLNTRDFVQQLKGIRLQQDECIISYDVKTLLISVPIQPVINIIHNKLANVKDLQQRTSIAIHHIISLLQSST